MRQTGARVRVGRAIGLLLGLLLALLPIGGLDAALPARAEPEATSPAAGATELTIPVDPEPDGSPVRLDATIYPPAIPGRHPAVVLAHGFGGSKAGLATQAQALADAGFVVLAYSARGFGASGGRIHLNAPDREIADARHIVDLLATRDDVQLDAADDPRVGVAGGSYGGALALMLAGADRRIDATVAAITWHDLADSFVPGGLGAEPGVFKRRWASLFFSSAVQGNLRASGKAAAGAAPAAQVCGRFDPTLCRLFLDAARTGTASPQLLQLLRRNSPAPTLPRLRAPTLLVQGMRDSLFDLAQADATATALQRQGTPVAVRWFDGGHDGGAPPGDEETVLPWFERYLTDSGRQRHGLPVPAFTAPIPVSGAARTVSTDSYPGLAGVDGAGTTLTLHEPTEGSGQLLSPPGGDPAAISGAGGFGAIGGDGTAAGQAGSGQGGQVGQGAGLAGYQLAALPGQSLAFETDAVAATADVVGAPRVRLRVTSTARDATLFVSLWRMSAGGPVSPRGQVTPVRIATTPGQPTDVEVALPAGTYSAATGSRWRVLVSATDAGFAVPTDARAYSVGLAEPTLRLPTAPGATTAGEGVDRETLGAALALAALLVALTLAALVGARRRRRSDRRETRSEYADVPLVVDNLVKTYKDGHRAVDDVSWRAESGQVVGLLGPNGAGKTTTMRMLVGLIRPDSGHVHVLGEPVHAGSPVLGRVGALIEGPGFLPHRTGRQNLHAYWEATGRDPAEAGFDAALEVAALGGAVDRPVRTYSQGMKQRLGIAQAMLGRPEVLLLDEPTNGLDPPQIAAMRPILRAYAATGRTVVVSSHLLSEVEQTCSHVVVMNGGRVVTAGSVAELTGDSATVVHLENPAEELETVAAAVRADLGEHLSGVRIDARRGTLTLRGDADRADVVAGVVRAGGRIVEVSGRRRLEEVFLGVIGQGSSADALDGHGHGHPGAGPGPHGESNETDETDGAGQTGHVEEVDEDEEARTNRLRQVRAR